MNRSLFFLTTFLTLISGFKSYSQQYETTIETVETVSDNDWYYSLNKAIKAIENNKKVEKLSISKLSDNDTSLYRLRDLKKLEIRESKIKTILNNIHVFKNLETLRISDCDSINSLPETMGKLTQLNTLDFNNLKKFEKLPQTISELHNLKGISFYKTPKLQNLPIANKNSIKRLSLSDCYSLKISQNIKFDSLQSIYLNQCKGIGSSIFQTLTNSQKLISIYIIQSNINTITKELDNCIGLTYFTITDSSLSKIEARFNRFQKLESIKIDNSKLKQLPDSLANLPNCKYLTLNYNDSLQHEQACTLFAKMNIINLTLRLSPSLKLPQNIGSIKTLEVLTLNTNDQSIPLSICELKNLNSLVIENTLTSIPEDFGKLQNLHFINFEKQQFKNLPKSIWTAPIATLDFSDGKLCSIPSVESENTVTKSLILQGNTIKELPESIQKIRNLEELHIDENEIKKLPKSLSSMTNLKVLGLCNMKNLDFKQAFDVIKEIKGLTRIDLCERDAMKLPKNAFECKQLQLIKVIDDGCKYSSLQTYKSMDELKNNTNDKTKNKIETLDYTVKEDKIDTANYAFKHYFATNDISDAVKWGNTLYFGTRTQGILKYNIATKNVEYFNTRNSKLRSNNISKIAVYKNTICVVNQNEPYGSGRFFIFDGVNCTSHRIDIEGIKDGLKLIQNLVFDKNGVLWIKIPSHLLKFEDNKITIVSDFKKDFPLSRIDNSTIIIPDKQNNIWLLNQTKLFKLTPEKKWIVYDSIFPKNSYMELVGLAIDSKNRMYAVNQNQKIMMFENNKWQEYKTIDSTNQSSYFYPNSLSIASDDSTLIVIGNKKVITYKGLQKGIFSIDKVNRYNEIKTIISGDSVWTITNENISFYTIHNPTINYIKVNNCPLAHNKIIDIATYNNVAYIATQKKVYRYTESSFEELLEVPFDQINVIKVDKKGVLYVCGNGIAKYENNAWIELIPHRLLTAYNPISTLYFASDNSLWVSFYREIGNFDGVKWQFFYNNGKNGIKSFNEDTKGNILFSEGSSIYTIQNKKTPELINTVFNEGGDLKYIESEPKSNIWVHSYRVTILSTNTNERYMSSSLKGATVIDATIDNNKDIWVASKNKIVSFNNKLFYEKQTINKELLDSDITSIAFGNNQLFVGTDSGLFIFKIK